MSLVWALWWITTALGVGFWVGSLVQLRWYEDDLNRLQAKSSERDAQLSALLMDYAMWKRGRSAARKAVGND